MSTESNTEHTSTSASNAASAKESLERTLRRRIDAQQEDILDQLCHLVSIPSVAWESHDLAQVEHSAEAVADLAREAGFPEVEILRAPRPDGEQGMPAVVARRPAREGCPTVLLYAHHDVQPADDLSDWKTSPFTASRQGERLFGRGAADDKAGVMVHLSAARLLFEQLGEDLGVGLTLFIEGEEEAGSPSFENFLAEYEDRLNAQVIVVADSANWRAGVPALTSSLRGMIAGTVRVRTMDHALHSGMFGGPLLDATTVMVRLLSTLHDEDGAVAVSGLVQAPDPAVDYAESDFRADSGVFEQTRLAGRGSIASRLWTQPALSIIGMDVTSVEASSNTMNASSAARLSMRLAPGQDPQAAHQALRRHLEDHAPFGAEVVYEPVEQGQPYEAESDSPAAGAILEAMRQAWGVDPVLMGMGGSIPFVASLTERFPQASILITGIEDPDTRAHSANESLYLPDFWRAIEAEALFLTRVDAQGRA